MLEADTLELDFAKFTGEFFIIKLSNFFPFYTSEKQILIELCEKRIYVEEKYKFFKTLCIYHIQERKE